MLPDFPTEKEKLLKRWSDFLEQKRREYLGFFADTPGYRHYEGNRWITTRADGSVFETNYKTIESGLSIHVNEVPDLTPDKIARKLAAVAREIADQMEHEIFQTFIRGAEKSGRSVRSKQQPFDRNTFLDALEAIDVSFDSAGKIHGLTVFIPPSVAERIKDELEEWEHDSEFNARYERIVEQKREEWRDRESRRKLVE